MSPARACAGDHGDGRDDRQPIGAHLPGGIGGVLSRTPPQGPLTARESEIVELLSQGHTNRQIACRLGISPRTVDKHPEHAYTKLHSRGAGRVAVATRWLTETAEHKPTRPFQATCGGRCVEWGQTGSEPSVGAGRHTANPAT